MKSILTLQVCFLVLFLPAYLNALEWSEQEFIKLKQFSALNIGGRRDPSNKFTSNVEAIKFGRMLFSSSQLSNDGRVSCASCHIAKRAFTDNRVVPRGRRRGFRNTPTLLNVSEQNWFFWDGSKDSLWAQALSAIENPAEQDFSRTQLFHLISTNRTYRDTYEKLFNHRLPDEKHLRAYPYKASISGSRSEKNKWEQLSVEQKSNINRAFANIGKAIAAYVTTIKSPPTRFDRFLKQLLRTGRSQILNDSEQKGLKLFIGDAACSNCHSSSIFSDRMFHNIGTGIPAVDNGRSDVIGAVIQDDFNCLGEYSDARQEQCTALLYANTDRYTLMGSYKTPTLRSISKTAPYFHDGRYENLYEVLRHYSNVDSAIAGITDLSVVNLSREEQKNIIDFLLSL